MDLESDCAPDTREKVGPKVRLKSLDDLDGRMTSAKRARQLVSALESDLGGSANVSTAERQLIRHAALLGAYIEDAEVRWLRHEPVDLNDFLAAINSQRRLLATIGLERKPRDVITQAQLDRYLRYAEERVP
jgi:hypothetical protein